MVKICSSAAEAVAFAGAVVRLDRAGEIASPCAWRRLQLQVVRFSMLHCCLFLRKDLHR